jgi:hypothetical protein
MPYVSCPCGAEVSVVRIVEGWRPDLGCSFDRHCIELREAVRDKVVKDFDCKRLSRLVAERSLPSAA